MAAAKAELAQAGVPFEQVVQEFSTEPPDGQPLNGELPPFSREDARLPQNFKDAAFALKVGEVSEPVEAGNAYHLIKLEERVPPKAVKFEMVKDSIRRDLAERATKAVMERIRTTSGRWPGRR